MRLKITVGSVIAFALLLGWDGAMNVLARAYELGYLVCHYDYEHLSDPGYFRELSFQKKILCKREFWSEEMRAFLEGKLRGERLSSRGKTTTEKILVDGTQMIVKREEVGRGLFCPGRGVSIWNNAHRAIDEKIPAITPIALFEDGGESKVVYLYEGSDLKRLEEKEKVVHFSQLVKRLKSRRAIHHDLRLKNVVQLEEGGLKLIDIDKFHIYPKLSLLYYIRLDREVEKFKWDWNRKTTVPLKFTHIDRSFWNGFILFLARLYEQMYALVHYDYAALDKDYIKELGVREKFVCKREDSDLVREALSKSGTILHERSNRVTKKITVRGRDYILKKERAKGFWKNLFFMTRGVSIWNNAHLAKSLGFPVLTPLAMMERRSLREVESSVLYLMEGRDSGSKGNIDRLISVMKDLRLIHHDFRAKNLVVLEGDRLQCIDIDRLHRYPRFSYVFHERLQDEIEKFHYQEGLIR